MGKFRLPRKLKKKLKGKIFLYPSDGEGSLMTFPTDNQKDYDAYKRGELERPFSFTKRSIKESNERFRNKYEREISISDEELKEMVYSYFAEEYRESSLRILLRAKNHPIAIKSYHTFINAYNEDEWNIICGMSVDSAEMNLKK